MMTVLISLVMLFFKQIFLKQAKRLSATVMEMSQIYKDKVGDNTETTEMHDNPLHDPDEEQGQVKKDEEEQASDKEDFIADESHVDSIIRNDDNEDTDIDISHVYRDSGTDVIPMRLNPMRDPEDLGNNDRNIAAVQDEVMQLKSKNASLEYEKRVLQQRVQDLESQGTHQHQEEEEDNENL